MMELLKVGVIAGTFVDTQMGVEYLQKKGIQALGFPVSTSPEEQSQLQILSPVVLTELVRTIIKGIKEEGIGIVWVYCNSLSAAVNMDQLAEEEQVSLITPLTVYKRIAANYQKIGILAANNQSAAGIERVIQSVNPDCFVLGLGILPLVLQIEKGKSSQEIMQELGLDSIIDFFNTNLVDVLILGCTHFPYIKTALESLATVPILDPADLMYELIISNEGING